MARPLHARPPMHLPFGPATAAPEEHALPEIVPIEDLSARALDEAAREIAEGRPEPAEALQEEEASTWPTATT